MSRSRVEVPGGVADSASHSVATPARAMTEAQLQQAVIDAAHTFGWLVHHVKPARTPDGKYLTRIAGDAGFPDLIMVRGGRTLFVELKSEKGRLRPEQSEWINRLDAAHQEVFIWRPEDWTNQTILRELRKP